MEVINSYYSNLIEGNHTQPYEIRAAQRGKYHDDPIKRDLQKESVAHIHVQKWIKQQVLDQNTIYSSDFLKALHREFYTQLPERMWEIKDDEGNTKGKIIPGEWRTDTVKVGLHVPPSADNLESLMQQFCEIYHPRRYSGERKYIALMCAHHRFVWVHPFLDGNGRVARLFTDAALSSLGLNSVGVWYISRGVARAANGYKGLLARADFPRQGMHDGRGLLSQENLVDFCRFMLAAAIDQITYMTRLLDLGQIQKRISRYIQARNDNRVPAISAEIKEIASLVLYQAFIHGELERQMAYELCGMSERSARRLLAQLKEEGLLTETSSRSPLKWSIPEHAEPWYFPELVPGQV
ncbi:MAG: Fic family protein [Gammaproteobacteria bacterium]|nr:Fic family protein [Gammaproteobacteria bacterium]